MLSLRRYQSNLLRLGHLHSKAVLGCQIDAILSPPRLKAHEREMEVLYGGKTSTGNEEELQRIAEAVREATLARERLGAQTAAAVIQLSLFR